MHVNRKWTHHSTLNSLEYTLNKIVINFGAIIFENWHLAKYGDVFETLNEVWTGGQIHLMVVYHTTRKLYNVPSNQLQYKELVLTDWKKTFWTYLDLMLS
jgi:hypothetical protein